MPPMIRALALTLILAAFTVACTSGTSEDPPISGETTATSTPGTGAACAPALPHTTGTTTEKLASGGVDRKYLLYIPPEYDGIGRVPLVLALHGFIQPAESLAAVSELEAAADSAGYVIAFPEGTGSPLRWNAYESPDGADDVAFLGALLDELADALCIDGTRVYTAGYSNGGGMSLLLACKLEDRLAAIAVVAATFVPCQANVPMVAFHGNNDPIVPYEGGGAPTNPAIAFPPVRRGASEWAAAAGCDTLPIISRPNPEIELSTFRRCLGGDGDVLLYTVIDGGHTWPGGLALPENIVGRTTDQIDASAVILEFFDAHPPRRSEEPSPAASVEAD